MRHANNLDKYTQMNAMCAKQLFSEKNILIVFASTEWYIFSRPYLLSFLDWHEIHWIKLDIGRLQKLQTLSYKQ